MKTVVPSVAKSVFARPRNRLLAGWVLFALAYYLAAKLGLLMAIAPGSASPVWPPAGLAVAILLRFGLVYWPGILLGEVLAVVSDGLSPGVAFGMGIGNVLEAGVTVWLVRRFSYAVDEWMHHSHDVFVMFLGATVGALLAASIGVLSLNLGGVMPEDTIPLAWVTWMLGDLVGIVVVLPLLISWMHLGVDPRRQRGYEALLISLATMGLGLLIFAGGLQIGANDYPLVLALLPLLVLAAFRVHQRLLTTLVAVFAIIAILGTAQGLGPFGHDELNVSMLSLQGFIGIIASTVLLLSAVLVENSKVTVALEEYQDKLENRILRATRALSEANDSLREERNFMSVIQDTAQSLLLVMGRDGRILTFNAACQRASGYSAEEAIGRKSWDFLLSQADAQEMQARFAEPDSCSYPFYYECRWLTRDSDSVQIEWRNNAIYDDAGRVQYVVAIGVDITDRKRTEEALRQATVEWNYAMDFLEDGICIVDINNRLMRANKAFYEMTGLNEEAEGRDILKLLCPSDKGGCSYLLTELLLRRNDGVVTLEVDELGNPAGVPLEVTTGVICDRDDRDVGMLISLHDQTHARQTEAELSRLSDHVRLLLESTDEGIYGIDREGHCTFVNLAAARMLGYPPESLRDRHMHQLIHHLREDGSAYPYEQSPIFQTLREGRAMRSDDEVFWRQDGKSFPVSYSSNPILENDQVIGAVVVFHDITEQRSMARRMDFLASHDALTGLYNRLVFERHVARAIESAREEGRRHVLCYLDLDQFKVVNDTCGHVAGDELLRQLATLLGQRIRRSDILARLGGDEFGVLLDSCDLDEATRLIEGMLAAVRDFRFSWENKAFAVGMSIGVVAINSDTESLASALSAADSACYIAKDRGRNRAHVYEEEDLELSQRRGEMQWVSRLHSALDEQRLFVEGQPIIDLSRPDAEGLALEVLVRLRDEQGNVVPPGAFIPAAERYNVMSRVDRWVIAHVFQWINVNHLALRHLRLCTINLSGQSVGSEEFLQEVLDLAVGLQVPADTICFELTETAAVSNLAAAAHFISELKSHGFRFALDDFGSGMSSFAYLKNLPVDFLKIDGNFVRDIADDRVDYAMVEAVNRVGHVMGLKTIAEFVENGMILEKLQELGVDYAQGFYLGRPVSLATLLPGALH